jgi:hypothetical protein
VPVFFYDNEDVNVELTERKDLRVVAALRVIVFVEHIHESRQTLWHPQPQGQDSSSLNNFQQEEDEFGRGSQAYQVAWELEMWKRSKQEEFELRCSG